MARKQEHEFRESAEEGEKGTCTAYLGSTQRNDTLALQLCQNALANKL
jgi:hypothetical protein